MAATSLTDDPEAHRRRLERLKTVDPDNALAGYLSAWNEFRDGNPQKALEELTSALTRKSFNDYLLESARNTESLLIEVGRSPAEAKAIGTSSSLLPHLSQLKQLSRNLAELQGQYLSGGDAAAAENVARMGLHMGRQLMEGPGSVTLIADLVGIAIQKNLVQGLDPAATYDFLGGTPTEYLAGLERRREQSKPSSQIFESWIRQAPESEIVDYFSVLQTQGERAALKWLQSQGSPTPPPDPPTAGNPESQVSPRR